MCDLMKRSRDFKQLGWQIPTVHARWASSSYKWSYNPYKWPYEWVTGVVTPISGVITLLMTGRAPLCGMVDSMVTVIRCDKIAMPQRIGINECTMYSTTFS